jgi:predicted NBD/HSP70 family sugar kinase
MPDLPVQSLGMRDVRIVNEVRLLNVIRRHQPISRTQISSLTGLNASTVTMIVKRLLAHDMISEASTGTSTGGRRPTFLTINPNKMLVLGVDLGVWQTSYTVADFSGRQILWRTLPTLPEAKELIRQPLAIPEDFVQQLCEDILKSLAEAKLTKERGLSAVGVSVPELVDVQEGSMVLGANDRLVKVRIRQLFEERLGVPTFVDNDANSAALAEIWMGSGKLLGSRNIAYVLVVEGIGTALIIEGRLHRGSRIGTGSFGHMPMDPNGPPCFCGARGCWETLASEKALRRRFAELGGEDGTPGSEGTQAAAIIAAALRGNPTALAALTANARSLSLGILGLVHGLAPQAIIVGGQVVQAWNLIRPIINETVRSRTYNPFLAEVDILPSSVPYPPSLLGAVAIAISNMLEQHVTNPSTLSLATLT